MPWLSPDEVRASPMPGPLTPTVMVSSTVLGMSQNMRAKSTRPMMEMTRKNQSREKAVKSLRTMAATMPARERMAVMLPAPFRRT